MRIQLSKLLEKKVSGEWGTEDTDGIGVKVIRTANFTNLGIIDYSDIVSRIIDNKKIEAKKLIKGDIIIEKSGGSPNQPVGRVVYFNPDDDDIYLTNNFTSCLRSNTKLVDSKYLFYLLRDLYNKRIVLKYQNKTTGIINLKLDDYLKEEVIIPKTIREQKQIATLLSKVESLISKRKQSIDLLEEYIKCIFFEFFGKQENSKYPIYKLNDVATKINDGEHGTVKQVENGILYLMARNINRNNELELTEVSYVTEEAHQKMYRRCNPEKGDILLVCVGATIGKAAIVPEMEEFSIARSVALIKPNYNVITSEYILNYLNTNYAKLQIKKSSNAAAQAGLYIGKLKEIKIPVPPIELQNKFDLVVNKVREIIELNKKHLYELNQLLGSLSQKYFNKEEKYSNADGKGEPSNELENDFDESKLNSHQKAIRDYIKKAEEDTNKIPKEELEKQFNQALEQFKNDGQEDTRYGDPFEVDEKTAKKQGKKFYEQWKKFNRKSEYLLIDEPGSKINWQQLANHLKMHYANLHFNFEMLLNFAKKQNIITNSDYFSSEELKMNPKLNDMEDLKSFVHSAINNVTMDEEQERNKNKFITFKQVFYNAIENNIDLKLHSEDYKILSKKSPEERTGIYFEII